MRRLSKVLFCGAALAGLAGLTGPALAAQADQSWQHGDQLWGSEGKVTWTQHGVRINGTGWDRSIGASTLITFASRSGAEDTYVDSKEHHVPHGEQPFVVTLRGSARQPIDAVRVTTFQRGIGMAYSYDTLRRP
ncbi:MAG: hypothetical protein GEV03_22475 [Streptosporangiales bacterium]|nr:hypothetical protein [Streptosporangiales bacterium]